MKLRKNLFGLVAGLLLIACPALAEDAPPPMPHGPEFCKENPGKCEEARAKHEAFCKENPEKCEQMKQRRAERQERCKQNPEKCERQRERMKKRHAEFEAECAAEGPEKCEAMKQARRERFKKRFGDGKPDEGDADAE